MSRSRITNSSCYSLATLWSTAYISSAVSSSISSGSGKLVIIARSSYSGMLLLDKLLSS